MATALVIVAGEARVHTTLDSKTREAITSIHVFAFTPSGGLLVSESEGSFGLDEWQSAHDQARTLCCAEAPSREVIGSAQALRPWLKQVVVDKVEKEQSWKS